MHARGDVIQFQILGRTLTLTGPITESLEAGLRSRWDFPEYRCEPHVFRLEIEHGNPPTGFPLEASSSRLELVSGTVECRNLEPVIWIGDATNGLRIELLETQFLVHFWGEQVSIELLHIAIAEGLRASGLISLHASIAARDGLALAFLGPSGRGKTTTLLRALEAGFTPVCEDFAWCDPESLLVYGFDRGLRLLPDTAQHFETRFGITPSVWQGDKWFVPYSSLKFERQAVKLHGIALLERDPESQTGFEPLAKREAALAFWEASGMPLSGLVQTRISGLVAVMVARLERHRLRLGQGEIPFEQTLSSGRDQTIG
jgi:hypothetical protein